MMIGYEVPEFSTDTLTTAGLDVIGQLLFSRSAPLYQELVVDEQWADFLGGDASWHRDPYLFTISSRLRSDDLLPKVEERIEAELAKLKAEPVSAERLERVKSHLRYQIAMGLDSASSVADLVATFLNLTGDAGSINALFAQFDQLTPADIQRIAREVFDEKRQTVVTLVHASEETAADATTPGRSER
jgi:zinc protease